jgi:L-lysine exporter family protein LysE/ArgO
LGNSNKLLICQLMALTQIIIQGLITGIILTMSFGAGFFALIQTSLLRGYKKGLFIALGAIICDTIYIGISIFSTSFVSEELPKYAQQIKSLALVAFVGLGIRTIVKSSKIVNSSDQGGKPNYYYITKGFILNIVNPLVLITWLGITLFLESSLNYNLAELLLYFTAVLLATFASQSAICVFSHKIKNYLSDGFMHKLNIFIGILFILIGLVLFFQTGDTGMEIEKARNLIH